MNADHRRDSDTGRDQDERCRGAGVHGDITERQRDRQGVTEPDPVVQPGRDLAGGPPGRGIDAFHREHETSVPGQAEQAVLPQLAGAVGQRDAHRDVLARSVSGQRPDRIGGFDGEHRDAGGIVFPGGHQRLPEDRARRDPGLRVEPVLQGDERVGHQPVHAVPGGGDRFGDHLGTENRDDGGKEVFVDHVVLLGGDPEGRVFVADPGEHRVRLRGSGIDQPGGEAGDGRRQRARLAALGLVATVEQVTAELRMPVEQVAVEGGGDRVEIRLDQWQRGTDDIGVPGIETGRRGGHIGVLHSTAALACGLRPRRLNSTD